MQMQIALETIFLSVRYAPGDMHWDLFIIILTQVSHWNQKLIFLHLFTDLFCKDIPHSSE